MKIGLALSGGGMRAAVFHLGVLRCLAEHGLFEQIAHISSVSGASICMGLIYGCHDHRWPDDVSFLQEVYPKIKTMITQKDIQWHSLARLLIEPYYWDKKVNLLANVMKQRWNVEDGPSILLLMKVGKIFVFLPNKWDLFKQVMYRSHLFL